MKTKLTPGEICAMLEDALALLDALEKKIGFSPTLGAACLSINNALYWVDALIDHAIEDEIYDSQE